MENDDSFVMDEPAAEINYADVFNERALSLARELRVKRTIGRPSIRRVWTDSPRVLVEITGHTWTIDGVSGFHLKRVVQQEFKKEGILKTASSSISMNEINETDVNPEFDLVVGFASDNLNSPAYMALGTLVTRHFSTHIYFMVPTKRLGGIENPNGNSLVTSQIIIMIWYMFRTRIPGRVCRLLKSTLDRNGNVIRYVELPVIDGCDLIRNDPKKNVGYDRKIKE